MCPFWQAPKIIVPHMYYMYRDVCSHSHFLHWNQMGDTLFTYCLDFVVLTIYVHAYLLQSCVCTPYHQFESILTIPTMQLYMHLPPPSIGIENMSVGCPNDVCYGNVVCARVCIWVHLYMACVQGLPWNALYHEAFPVIIRVTAPTVCVWLVTQV